MRLVIACSNAIMLQGLKCSEEFGLFVVLDTAQRAKETRELVARHLPDVLLVEDELALSDGALLSDCRSGCPAVKIVLVEGPGEPAPEVAFLNADAYVRRHSSLAELARVVESLGRRFPVCFPRMVDSETKQE